jgi:hypothetical protein
LRGWRDQRAAALRTRPTTARAGPARRQRSAARRLWARAARVKLVPRPSRAAVARRSKAALRTRAVQALRTRAAQALRTRAAQALRTWAAGSSRAWAGLLRIWSPTCARALPTRRTARARCGNGQTVRSAAIKLNSTPLVLTRASACALPVCRRTRACARKAPRKFARPAATTRGSRWVTGRARPAFAMGRAHFARAPPATRTCVGSAARSTAIWPGVAASNARVRTERVSPRAHRRFFRSRALRRLG